VKIKGQPTDRGTIFVVSGPSGSGKTTLLNKFFQNKRLRASFAKSISFTTRPKRSREKDKQDYFFISQDEFRRNLRAKKILEWTRYLGHYYATPRNFVERSLGKGRHLVLCLDLKGVRAVKRLYPKNTVTIFIAPPSVQTLKRRIVGRCRQTKKEELERRLELARKEILSRRDFDYCIENKNLQQAAEELTAVVLERLKDRC
jgi:guanylate kinase